jgi:hypothetical protein
MQDSPDKAVLLEAVARFLATEVRPALADPALGFQVLIAANLAQIAAAEIRGEDAQDAAQLERLEKFFRPNVPLPAVPATRAERHARIRELEQELVARIRARTLGASEIGDAWALVKQTLREKLAVVNPRFDLREEIDP